jgi:fumarate reductase flavoprotein subunit
MMGTNGGVIVDGRLRVLDKDQEPIPGLYAVGNCAGGRYGNDYPTVINGSTHGTALTMGYCVAEFIDEDAK